MKLTSENVDSVMRHVLFKKGEDHTKYPIVEGLVHNYVFHPERLEEKRQDIIDMLNDFPDPFHKDKGGGWAFVNACMTKDNVHWGEHWQMEQIICLGIAIGCAEWVMKELMFILPGGMPYVVVKTPIQVIVDDNAKSEGTISEG